MRLLALMHYRSHSDLGDWIPFECEQFFGTFHGGVLKIAYNPHSVVASGLQFGTLVQWEQGPGHGGKASVTPVFESAFEFSQRYLTFCGAWSMPS
jgi:hypothetical protein